MKIVFCKTAYMKYYNGVTLDDMPYNGGSYIAQNGTGGEVLNFTPTVHKVTGEEFCFGFFETTHDKTKSSSKKFHIEKIKGCDAMKNADSLDDVLVVWCATADTNETVIVGWYKHATVYRNYQCITFDDGTEQYYNVSAKADNCVLLPDTGLRRRPEWKAPLAKKTRLYGFGQSAVWYANEASANHYIESLISNIESYNGTNLVKKNRNTE